MTGRQGRGRGPAPIGVKLSDWVEVGALIAVMALVALLMID